jgi:hypothetical protein
MKYTRSFITGFIACGLAFAMLSTVSAQGTKEGVAKVVRIVGKARYQTGNSWMPLKVGDVLRPGSIIQTEAKEGTHVDLVLGDGSGAVSQGSSGGGFVARPSSRVSFQPSAEQNTVRVYENSLLGIDKLTAMETGADTVTDTQLDLRAGRILGNVKKMSAASRYEIKLPNGVAGIRGTVYEVSADGVVKVADGTVVVSWVDPTTGKVMTKVVTGGQSWDPRSPDVFGTLSPGQISDMKAEANSLQVVYVTPSTFNVDQTVYYVSPTVGAPPGDNGGGDGGDGVSANRK